MKSFANQFVGQLSKVTVPWVFDRKVNQHLLFQGGAKDQEQIAEGVSSFINEILRLYLPGSVRFLFIDPIGLGANFAQFLQLSDFDEKLVTNKAWSSKKHIKEQLEKIVEHIEGVVQKYLRSDFESIDEYNQAAGEIAEPFRFIVIHGFPENFDSDAALALERIMENGPRCGVHVVLVQDTSKELPYGFKLEVLEKLADTLLFSKSEMRLVASPRSKLPSLSFKFDVAKPSTNGADVVLAHGRAAAEGARVEVPYNSMMTRLFSERHRGLEDASDIWESSNGDGLRAPLGPTGARKLQQLVLGEKGTTAHHALLVGKTGSGKSNLLHVVIMSMAELYSPEELSVMLVDFKKGVEFKTYAKHKLPHAKVVAIESEKEFGLNVLRGMDAEMTLRGEMFKDADVQDIMAYRSAVRLPLPRVLLIVDEFHELLADEDAESREALGIIENIVRQGRGFGMHLVLATQSLAGVQIPRAVLEQIGVRIAMQCSDADSRMILADDNTAARLLDRAGEAIYNDKNGLVEGNNLFQAALLAADDRDARLKKLRERALQQYPDDTSIADGPFVFEGSEPAKLEECRALQQALKQGPPDEAQKKTALWVGEPIAMAPAHAMEFKSQSGANLLIIDRNEELAFGVVYSCLLSIAAQHDAKSVIFHFVDLSSADAYWADLPELFEAHFPHPSTVYARRDLEKLLTGLANEVEARNADDSNRSGSKVFLFLFGIQRARDLRQPDFGRLHRDEERSLHDNLNKILREGPECGVHTILWCDTFQNVDKCLQGSALNEIGQRISGTLSSGDSMRLFDNSIASKLSRENRLICYDDERVGTYVHIRPFVPPSPEWVKNVAKSFLKKQSK